MSPWMLYASSGIVVLTVALYGLFTSEHLVRKIIAANLVGSGVFLVLVAVARRGPAAIADPVPHALVLTGIVVSVSATAAALALAKRLAQAPAEPEPPKPAAEPDGAEPDGTKPEGTKPEGTKPEGNGEQDVDGEHL